MKDTKSIVCSQCHGAKCTEERINAYESKDVPCKMCGGKGHLIVIDNESIIIKDSTMHPTIHTSIILCPICKGSGESEYSGHKCVTCNGTGRLKQRETVELLQLED